MKGEAKFDIVLYCVAQFTDAIAAAAIVLSLTSGPVA